MGTQSRVRFGTLAATHCVPDKKIGLSIVFVHGAWAGKWMFENWQNYCAERGWESYAFDLRGHNDSKADDLGKVSMQDYADDLELVVNTVGPCYVIGQSMGGLVAQMVAARSDKIKKAVFVTSAPPAGILAVAVNAFTMSVLKFVWPILLSRPIFPREKDGLRMMLANRVDPALWKLIVPESGRALRDIGLWRVSIKSIRCPTLVVAGEEDPMVPISSGREIARKYGSEYMLMPKMGHAIMLEKGWQLPIEKILEWLKT